MFRGSPLRLLNLAQILRKLGRADGGNDFGGTLWLALRSQITRKTKLLRSPCPSKAVKKRIISSAGVTRRYRNDYQETDSRSLKTAL